MRAQVVVIGGGRVRRELFLPPDRPGRAGRRAPRAGDARLGLDGALRRRRRDAVPRRGPGRPLRVVHPGVPPARGGARAPVRPPRVSAARPLGGRTWRGFHESVALQRAHGLTTRACSSPARSRASCRPSAWTIWRAPCGARRTATSTPCATASCWSGLGRAAGGRVLQGRRATGLRLRSGRVAAVECDGEAIECETVVNASGAWARRLGGIARADAARRRLSAPAGPVRAAAAAHDARCRW